MGPELKNEFSWSKSRDETFRECLRKYYFQYYGYWNGWKEAADPRTRQVYVLKNLQTRQMWAGDHVHRRIKDLLAHLRKGLPGPSADHAVEAMLQDMRSDFKASRAFAYRQTPKKVCGLFEHEYNVDVPDALWKENADHAVQCLRNFYGSEVLARIKQVPVADWLELEERSSFALDGLRVYVQLDFAYREGGCIVIWDWKTGRSEAAKNDLQLACYVLYAMDKWKVPPEQVTAAEFNLPASKELRHEVTAEILESTKDHIRESADEMLFPLSDPERNLAEEDAFDFAEEDRPCRRCNFLKVCPRYQQS